MPRLSQWYVRAALIYLLVGFSLGALMLSNKGLNLHPLLWRLLPVHIELVLSGWILHLALGVAFWILPRFWEGPPRGNELGAQLAFVLLNLGLWLVALGSALGWSAGLLLVGRLSQAAAVLAFAAHAWPRIVPRQG
ncbi:MAG: hypothetical protein R3300_08655 [Candidatus Promineifilaceae bacterium]|nr:hypothetical protein [Candidatus Promineifilaceae bacterium]